MAALFSPKSKNSVPNPHFAANLNALL